MGGSAGGLLMGAVANLAPEMYAAIVAQVPFVDALTSILDPELPLSALEWEEWGNPIEDPAVYAYMKSYSPYENCGRCRTRIAAVTSFNDTRVLYVEPAKWVPGPGSWAPAASRSCSRPRWTPATAALRPLRGLEGSAWDYAFVLDALGAVEPVTSNPRQLDRGRPGGIT